MKPNFDEMEYEELSRRFIQGLRMIAAEGAKRGLTEEESIAEYPVLLDCVNEIERISGLKLPFSIEPNELHSEAEAEREELIRERSYF